MRDKDTNILNCKKRVMYISADGGMKPLGKVLNGTTIASEQGSDCVLATDSLSFSCEIPGLSKWFENNFDLEPLRKAQNMLDQLRDYQALWNKYYGFGMRKERRKIERKFNVLAQRFVIHCKLYGITIKPKQQ